MKRLIIVRHAKAERGEPRGSDFGRGLADRGERDAPEIGRRLLKAGIVPDDIVSSPARRARRTAKLVARELGFPRARIRLEERIYEADLENLMDVVRETSRDVGSLMIVGHNPGLTELANALARAFDGGLPTCAALTLDLPGDGWMDLRGGSGTVVLYEFPKKTA